MTNQVELGGDLHVWLLVTLGSCRFVDGLVIVSPWSSQEACAVLRRRLYEGLLSSSSLEEGEEHL